ncbi:MAG: hypothetical protein U1G05_15560 [Kiritimatiellia bacterium]
MRAGDAGNATLNQAAAGGLAAAPTMNGVYRPSPKDFSHFRKNKPNRPGGPFPDVAPPPQGGLKEYPHGMCGAMLFTSSMST